MHESGIGVVRFVLANVKILLAALYSSQKRMNETDISQINKYSSQHVVDVLRETQVLLIRMVALRIERGGHDGKKRKQVLLQT